MQFDFSQTLRDSFYTLNQLGEAEWEIILVLLILRLPMIYLSSITWILKRTVEIHDLRNDISHTSHQAYLESC